MTSAIADVVTPIFKIYPASYKDVVDNKERLVMRKIILTTLQKGRELLS